MSKRLYVGNLSYGTSEDTLSSLFEPYGELKSVTIIEDRETHRSKGFGFVELADDAGAEKAISELDGKEVDGRRIHVNYAQERGARSRRSY